jgi:hypothetical protein
MELRESLGGEVIEPNFICWMYKDIWSQQIIETRLETPVLGYDHIPDALSNLSSLTVAQQSIK